MRRLKILSVVLLPSLKPACSSAMSFSACGFNLFSMIFSMTLLLWLMRLTVRYFWRCCRLPFAGSVMTKDWVHGVGHSPVCQILLKIVLRTVITSSLPAWTSSAEMLSTPTDFPFLQWLYCSLHFSAKDGKVILWVCLGTIQYWWISTDLVIVQLRAVFCPSVLYLSFFCEAFSWTILDSSRFPLFHSGQVFHQLVCPLTCNSSSDFLQSHYTVLLASFL